MPTEKNRQTYLHFKNLLNGNREKHGKECNKKKKGNRKKGNEYNNNKKKIQESMRDKMECQMLRGKKNIFAEYLGVENLHGREISERWKVSVIVTIYKARRDI